jgi:cytochrome c oxidase subunit 1/cytochrome c oxidase subunit I+III
MGVVSDGLPVFCRRPLVGYTAVALASVVTMVLGFGVWVHHMFATGLPNISLSFFSAASIIIVVPSAVAVFAWLATIWLGRPIRTTAFMFFASSIVLFTIGGVSGYMTGGVPVDWQLVTQPPARAGHWARYTRCQASLAQTSCGGRHVTARCTA